MFDINSLALVDAYELQLRNPSSGELLYADAEKQKPVVIKLYGTASKQYRAALTAMQNRALRRKQKGEKETAELLREEGLTLLLACAAGADNLSVDGKPVKGEAEFRVLFSDPRFAWVRQQADEALGDAANFLSQ